MKLPQAEEFTYRYPGKVHGHVPGAHVGTSLGSGDRFAGFADLFDYPDPRRLDVRASLRSHVGDASLTDHERWLVRRFQQRSSLSLWLLADLSRSMTVSSVTHSRVAKLAHMIAHSAIGLGDRFAMAGFDSVWRQDVSIMPTRQRSMPAVAAEQILNARPAENAGADGLIHAADVITSQRALVFLASDFCFDINLLQQTLRKLSQFMVIPIVWQHDDVDHFPSAAGWTEIRDSETGRRHSVWMRPSIKKRWQQNMETHFEKVNECFLRHKIKPLYVQGDITGEQLTQYFFAMRRS